MSLRISTGLTLPDEAVTQTFAILAKRGVGKTYTASVMVEEMLKNALHVVVVDPIGVWWGLRSSSDGKKAGLPIIVVGGEHGDVPLEPGSGELIANLIVDKGISMVVDISLMRKGEQKRFMIDFAETLYHQNRTALHLVLDEADEFAPQRPMGDDARMLGAIEDLVRRGRARGIGVTLITQRPAVLNKNVLTQIEVLIGMRLTSPQDRNALQDWVKYHADTDSADQMITSLPQLPIGTAWFWSPGWLDIFKKVEIRKRETFDSSSTPSVGQTAVQATKVATVDLEDLKLQMAATIEKQEQEDPKLLRRKIVELEKQLKSNKPEVQVKEVEIAVVPDDVLTCIKMVETDYQSLGEHLGMLREYVKKYDKQPRLAGIPIEVRADVPKDKMLLIDERKLQTPRDAMLVNIDEADAGEKPLSRAARAILAVLVQFPDGRTKIQISIQSGYSIKSSSFANALSELRSRGLISPAGRDLITLTDAGREAIPDSELTPILSGADLINYWQGKLGKSERTILNVLVNSYPETLGKQEISNNSGYSLTSSSFANALSKLRSLQLIEGLAEIRASDTLFINGSTSGHE